MVEEKEGYIRFNCRWIKSGQISFDELDETNKWRDKLYEIGLIGADNNGIGFGNISERIGNSHKFVISGSATGNFASLTPQHYSEVIDFDIEKNTLTCKGPIKASSESLSHGAVYMSDPEVRAVIHVHNKRLWKALLNKVPTTSKGAEFGTPEIALEIMRLFKDTDVRGKKIIVMGGHKDGIISFGKNLEEAGSVLLHY